MARAYITRTGRALSPGTVTRASLAIRRTHRKQGKPLPLHLQCHPKRQTPTPVHPGCQTFATLAVRRVVHGQMARTFGRVYFASGIGLKGHGHVTLYVQDGADGTPYTYKHDEPADALAWARAARSVGVSVEVVTATRRELRTDATTYTLEELGVPA
jgi:hypothetical protein